MGLEKNRVTETSQAHSPFPGLPVATTFMDYVMHPTAVRI